jgi:hypothetical protein
MDQSIDARRQAAGLLSSLEKQVHELTLRKREETKDARLDLDQGALGLIQKAVSAPEDADDDQIRKAIDLLMKTLSNFDDEEAEAARRSLEQMQKLLEGAESPNLAPVLAEEDFGSNDPLGQAPGVAVQMHHLISGRRRDDSLFSASARSWLSRAGYLAVAAAGPDGNAGRETRDGGRVAAVEPAHLLRAVFSGNRSRAKTPAMAAAMSQLRDQQPPDHPLITTGAADVAELKQLGYTATAGLDDLDRPVFASPELLEALAMGDSARRRTTPGQSRLDARHVLSGFLLSPVARVAFSEVYGDGGPAAWAIVVPAVLGQIETGFYSSENYEAWREIFAEIEKIEPPVAGPRVRTVGRYDPDAARALSRSEDPLDMVRDARAMAELVCLERAEPPLSIGVFGDWGSGKSTFMATLETEIRALSRQLEAEQGESGAATFVSDVTHVHFNAWHYSSGDLMASMAVQVFRALDPAEGASDAEKVRARFIPPGRLKALKTAYKAEHGGLAETRRELDAARVTLEQVRAENSLGKVLSEQVKQEAVDEVLQAAGLDAGAVDVESAREVVRKTSEWKALPAYFLPWFRRNRGLAVTLGLFAVAGGGAGLLFGEYGLALLGFFGPIIGVAGWLLKVIGSVLGPVREAQAAISDAEQRVDELTTRLESAAPGSAEEVSPTSRKLLQFFSAQRARSNEYLDRLGPKAIMHEDFELLAHLLDEVREAGDAAGLPSTQRIILYVDDLDRCRPDKVMEVLEAVHLLLALPLFVVVVGVDARWLEGALASHYRGQLGGSGQAEPTDYLEKIFQIPYWLKPPVTPSDRTRYERLIDSLVEVEPETGDGDGEAGEPIKRPDTEESKQTLEVVAMEPRPPSLEERYDHIQLKQVELDAIKLLTPLISKTPRGTKRFLNLYRFEKTRRLADPLLGERFLGTPEYPPEHFAVAFMLALDIDLAGETAALVEGLIAMADETGESEDRLRNRVIRWIEGFLGDLLVFRPDSPQFERRARQDQAVGKWLDEEGKSRWPTDQAEPLRKALDTLNGFAKSADAAPEVIRAYNRLKEDGRLPRLSFRRP